jgi:hypothetical protein
MKCTYYKTSNQEEILKFSILLIYASLFLLSSSSNWKTWMQDELADIEQEELDYVLVLSLSEQEEKGKKVIGMFHGLSALTLNIIQL